MAEGPRTTYPTYVRGSTFFNDIVEGRHCSSHLFEVSCSLSAQTKIESPLWKLLVDYWNCQNIFLSLKNVGLDFFFLLIHLVTFLEAF